MKNDGWGAWSAYKQMNKNLDSIFRFVSHTQLPFNLLGG